MMFLSMGIAAVATLASAYVHSYPVFLVLRSEKYLTPSIYQTSGYFVVLELWELLSPCASLLLRSQDPGKYAVFGKFGANNRHRAQVEYFKDVSRHKSLVGNLVHLLWAPGQVEIDEKKPHRVEAISIIAKSSNTQMLLALLAYTNRPSDIPQTRF